MTTKIPSNSQAWRYPPDHSTWDSYRSLELKNVPVSAPGKGEVLVKIHADILTGSGSYPLPLTDGPDGQGFIPTSDCAGDIVSIGPDVEGWKIGDRVHSLFVEGWIDGPLQPELWSSMLGAGIQGCLSQYRIFPADFILRIPTHLSYEQAATIPCAGATAWNALFGSRPITKDSTVLVQGSGGVSVFAAQIAKGAGARVIATTSSQVKADRYKTLGVDHVINYRETPEWSIKVKELTGGQGVDDVVEVGGDATLVQSIKSLKQRGYVHIIGFLAKPEPGQPSTLNNVASLLILPEATVRGVAIGSKVLTQQLDDFLEKYKIEPVVDPKVFEWNKAVEAIAYLESGAHFGKIVIRVD